MLSFFVVPVRRRADPSSPLRAVRPRAPPLDLRRRGDSDLVRHVEDRAARQPARLHARRRRQRDAQGARPLVQARAGEGASLPPRLQLVLASSTSLTRPCLAPAASECGHARVRVDHAAPARRDGAAEPVADGPAVGRRPLELSCCVSSLVQIPLSPSLSQCAVPVCIPSSQ